MAIIPVSELEKNAENSRRKTSAPINALKGASLNDLSPFVRKNASKSV
ncbi:hypothetical protein [Endozoicomonas sp. SCSIO W0465]|nr:hypothetical protein [Endozoicomonas sp. SCSIO W0465]USE39884.1 hypothetical protein MJO57_20520 [Endozoicomonas sp. SCSIO W0465]